MYVENYDPAEAVIAGAAVLDERVPDWREKVNPDTLDVSDTYNCVLGQVFGDDDSMFGPWGVGMRALFDSTGGEASVPHGFEAPYDHDETTSRDDNYDALTEAWINFLATD